VEKSFIPTTAIRNELGSNLLRVFTTAIYTYKRGPLSLKSFSIPELVEEVSEAPPPGPSIPRESAGQLRTRPPGGVEYIGSQDIISIESIGTIQSLMAEKQSNICSQLNV
jgi:hypothetical protein